MHLLWNVNKQQKKNCTLNLDTVSIDFLQIGTTIRQAVAVGSYERYITWALIFSSDSPISKLCVNAEISTMMYYVRNAKKEQMKSRTYQHFNMPQSSRAVTQNTKASIFFEQEGVRTANETLWWSLEVAYMLILSVTRTFDGN